MDTSKTIHPKASDWTTAQERAMRVLDYELAVRLAQEYGATPKAVFE